MSEPIQLHPEQGAGFVGRRRELTALTSALERARGGRGSMFLVGGEPGIGKSRLADELSGAARAQGFTVLWGRCWEGGGAPAFWPWVQCLRGYLRATAPDAVVAHIGTGASDVSQILPDLATTIPGLPIAMTEASDSARFRLFDSTATLLRNAADDNPLLIVIDDLHSADTPSLLLLRFMSTQVADARLVVVATYREFEVMPDHPATAAMADIAREPTTGRIELRGLDFNDVALLADRMAGIDAPRDLVLELHRRTSGNPLFVRESMKLLAAEGGLVAPRGVPSIRTAIPAAVRDVITRRLGHLSQASRDTLRLAAVLGPEVPAEVLRRFADVSFEQLLEPLDEAVAAGLLVEVGGAIGRYRFSHDLVREVLYDELSAVERTRLHLRAGETLEALYGAEADRHLGEIAHHLFAAAPGADPAKVVDYTRRAARAAVSQLAYEEAVRLYRMALQVMELEGGGNDRDRCELLLELGDAQTRAGDAARARETFIGAAALARRLGMAGELAQAALGYGGRFVWVRAANDRNIIPLLEDALQAQAVGDTVLRARLLARLAGALRDQPQPQARDDLSRQAVEMARRLDDPGTLAYALDGRFSAIWAPDTLEERLRIADEIIEIAQSSGDMERAFQGHHYRLATHLEVGDLPAARAELEENSRLAEHLRQPAQRWYVRANVAVLSLLVGDLRSAEAQILDAFEHGRQAESVHALGVVRLQEYALRREQGRAAELEGPIRELLDEYAFWPWMRCTLLHLYTELDRTAEARSLYEAIASHDFRDLPWDNDWLMGMSLLAEVVCHLRDNRRAALLYDMLVPYADRNAYGHPEFCTGSVSRPLGVLGAQLERWSEAEGQFERAIAMNERMGAVPWIARTQFDYATALLLRRRAAGDEQKAQELLHATRMTARERGMTDLARRSEAALDDLIVPAAALPSPAAAEFLLEGEYWTVTFVADRFRLRDSLGMRYLARLLAAPGREHLALDLVAVSPGNAERPATRGKSEEVGPHIEADVGAQLDEHARTTYRQRLGDLEAELSEAEAWNDTERVARARSELDFLARELSGAVGLGGRPRVVGSPTERARLSVTRAIRLAMKRIRDQSDSLGEHLEATIRTGTYCSYQPDPRLRMPWKVQ